nr:MAG: hypothetical protein [Microvirus sp.]
MAVALIIAVPGCAGLPADGRLLVGITWAVVATDIESETR